MAKAKDNYDTLTDRELIEELAYYDEDEETILSRWECDFYSNMVEWLKTSPLTPGQRYKVLQIIRKHD